MIKKDSRVLEILRRKWMLCFLGDDQMEHLHRLGADLRREPSPSGDGKQIKSAFAYWGVGPTLAWDRACSDQTYVVMRQSIESFHERWESRKIKGTLFAREQKFHYVSLGVGNGRKDACILLDLVPISNGLFYFPVDMSAEMLRIGVRNSTAALGGSMKTLHTYAVQIDFSLRPNLAVLRQLIHHYAGEEPILFSILGNTIANFLHDTERLKNLVQLLRPQDRLLLELAYTERADAITKKAACDEYSDSSLFNTFVTSSILHHTDLPVDPTRVDIISDIEQGDDGQSRSIMLKVVYRGKEGNERFTLPNRRDQVDFPKGDTIRLLITRKYTKNGIERLLKNVGCHVEGELCRRIPAEGDFGLALYVLRRTRGSVFISCSKDDEEFVQRLSHGLRDRGVDAWLYFDETGPRGTIFNQIKDAMENADKLLLVFSENSKDKEWIKLELNMAFERFGEAVREKLCLVVLTEDAVFRTWNALYKGDGQAFSAKLSQYAYHGFSNWRSWDTSDFEKRVARVADDLRVKD